MNHYLYYQIGKIKMATSVSEIKEVVRSKNLSTNTRLPKNVAGFFELRGRRICLFDLPSFLDIETSGNYEIIVAEINKFSIGFKVEKVYGIVSTEELLPYPELVTKKDYLIGVIKKKDEILQVLSFVKILSGPRLKAIQKYL
ncbi:MAG: chemotaxis protein CheW [candidate division WOR-3 bacterium]